MLLGEAWPDKGLEKSLHLQVPAANLSEARHPPATPVHPAILPPGSIVLTAATLSLVMWEAECSAGWADLGESMVVLAFDLPAQQVEAGITATTSSFSLDPTHRCWVLMERGGWGQLGAKPQSTRAQGEPSA